MINTYIEDTIARTRTVSTLIKVIKAVLKYINKKDLPAELQLMIETLLKEYIHSVTSQSKGTKQFTINTKYAEFLTQKEIDEART
tara:strand:- start:764 stop:1018 length:255 start_codon:yes stop_codon:yes gene_type:complete